MIESTDTPETPLTAEPPQPDDDQPLSWNCAFCGKIRVYEGGSPTLRMQDYCKACGSLLATSPCEINLICLMARHLL